MAEQTFPREVPAATATGARSDVVVRRRFRPQNIALYIVLVLLGLFFILPLVWMLSSSLKEGADVYRDQGWIPAAPSLGNFAAILGSGFPVIGWFTNSIIVSTFGTVLVLALTALSGYAFARMDFPAKNFLFTVLITTLLLPSVMFLVPQFLVVLKIGSVVPPLGLATLPSYLLPHLAGVFGVFFMRQFFAGIPIEIEEAAYVDGASRLKTLVSVVLPLAAPALATLSIITFLAIWNDYLWPLTLCGVVDPSTCTLQPGLAQFQGQYRGEYGLLMAGTVIASAPVLLFYVIAQRWIIQSVASSGVKG